MKATNQLTSITLALSLAWICNNSFAADLDAKWLTKDMWKADYINISSSNIDRDEAAFLESTKPGSGKNLELLNYISDNRCIKPTMRCYVLQSAAASAIIDMGKLEGGIKGAVNAYKPAAKAGACPIIYESTVLRYKLATLESSADSVETAKDLIARIQSHGGLTQDMRTETCNELAKEKPQLFQNYVALVSRLLAKGDSDMQKLGSSIAQEIKEETNE